MVRTSLGETGWLFRGDLAALLEVKTPLELIRLEKSRIQRRKLLLLVVKTPKNHVDWRAGRGNSKLQWFCAG